MSELQELQGSIAEELNALNDRIDCALKSPNTLLNSIIGNYLSVRGKQIRPIVVMLSAKIACGKVNRKAIEGGAAVELLHNASLIHDDVVDESRERRGRKTVNALWDNHVAVLVGDYFTTTALNCAIETNDLKIIDSICRLGKKLSLGELDQIQNARSNLVSEEAYMQVIDRKTASLFVACAEIGCNAVGASEETLKKLTDFALLLGLCFQIRDDIFDYFTSDGDTVGKPTGNDLREGKITLPLIHVLLQKDLKDNQKMIDLCSSETLTEAEIETLINSAIDNGGIEYAREKMRELQEKAEKILDTFGPSEACDQMRRLLSYVVTRDH